MSPPKSGQYEVVRELSAHSLLATDRSGRRVVLKNMPGDCLLEWHLHPNIAERLRRVREIAMTAVANLRGVERHEDRFVLVWDFVEGESFVNRLSDPAIERAPAIARLRELIHLVEHLHGTGLVHGALHQGNILIDTMGHIRLIDVGPLLFLDAERDERAVIELCKSIARNRRDEELVRCCELNLRPPGLSSLSARLSMLESNEPIVAPAPAARVRIRRRSLLAALVVICIGVWGALFILRTVTHAQPPELAPPRLTAP